ncbi:hypothetical protein L249_2382 [Ophiocordyceps polyrhachis-furcata BCC 54312]|uniref:FMN hydroxy acid dehydrogenase domain-containing protein n=1 Tax=Ophiocordyceps polyrhachis-furcata BCC 54312 TaxID=1330021 RepID=A0A367LS65_9HYPO|nr:hypothetical protein L249_2382 [Ophiocordyceps polyrhachis-furcata BCC 54312]
MARATLFLLTILLSTSLALAMGQGKNETTSFEKSFIVNRASTIGTLQPKNKTTPYAFYLKDLIAKGIQKGEPPVVTTDPNLLEETARKSMTERGFNYIRGSAGEGATMSANRLAFRQWKLVPRVLRPTTPRNLSVTLFGRTYDTPVIMAPIGVQAIYHPDKEIGTAEACAALHVPFTLSTAATTSIEDLHKAVPDGSKWFQLYWPESDDITASILKRAWDNKFEVLVVTLDTWTLGWRPRDIDTANNPFSVGIGDAVGFQDPVFRSKLNSTPEDDVISASQNWVAEAFPGRSHSWADLELLRKHWKGPIVLKGVLSAEDAKLAAEYKMDGIIVSTHGGRQLDGAVGSLDALPDVVEAVGDKITVMLDSGIRTGTDIIKALSLGAKAVLVGRPVVYGLGIDGAAGAHGVLAGILADLDLSMGFTGVKNVSELGRTTVRRVRDPAAYTSLL